jgi:hypothetical protein
MKTVILPSNIPITIKSPFSIKGKNDLKRGFEGGVVNTLMGEAFYLKSGLVDESEEFFLNIKNEPISSKISSVNVLSKEGVELSRSQEDDLLNTYIPIARKTGLGSIINYGLINSNFNFVRKSSEIRLTGYYKEGKVYTSSFLVLGIDEEIFQVVGPTEIDASEGSVIYINFSGSIKYYVDDSNDLYIDSFSISSGDPLARSVSSGSFSLRSDETDSNRELPFSIDFPIGIIKNSNYVALSRGNPKVTLNINSFNHFIEEILNEPVYQTDYTYSVYLSFV